MSEDLEACKKCDQPMGSHPVMEDEVVICDHFEERQVGAQCYACQRPAVDICPLCGRGVCELCQDREGEFCCDVP